MDAAIHARRDLARASRRRARRGGRARLGDLMIRIAVVGTGYVGLVTGACLADFGNRVRCVDVDEAKIARLSAGEIPFFEPGLEELVERNRNQKRLTFATDLAEAAQWAEVIFIT